jgi:hypothetical protein
MPTAYKTERPGTRFQRGAYERERTNIMRTPIGLIDLHVGWSYRTSVLA